MEQKPPDSKKDPAAFRPVGDSKDSRTADPENLFWHQFVEATTPRAFCQSWLPLQCRMLKGVRCAMVLLGEPDPTTAAELRRTLEQNGYSIELATDGPAVLQQAAVAPPGLILLREIMPKLNGAAVATLLAGMGSTAAIPVVLYEEGDIAGVDGAHARLTTHPNVRGRFTTTSPHILLDALKTLL